MLRILGSVSIMLNYNEKSVINTSNLTINRIKTTKREKNAEHGFQNHISTFNQWRLSNFCSSLTLLLKQFLNARQKNYLVCTLLMHITQVCNVLNKD